MFKKIVVGVVAIVGISILVAVVFLGFRKVNSEASLPPIEEVQEAIQEPDAEVQEEQSNTVSQETNAQEEQNEEAPPEEQAALEASVSGTGIYTCGACAAEEAACLSESDTFFPLLGTTLQQGDIVRTDSSGQANVQFSPEVELILKENTQIRIKSFEQTEPGVINIHVELLVGEAYFKANFINTEKQYDYKIILPVGVITSEEKVFSGKAQVSQTTATALTPEEIGAYLQELNYLNENCGSLCDEQNSCAAGKLLAESSNFQIFIQDISGSLSGYFLTSENINTIKLLAGQNFTYSFPQVSDPEIWLLLSNHFSQIAAGEDISDDIQELFILLKDYFASQGINISDVLPENLEENVDQTPQSCGDGVCDVYSENATTCSEDCK